MSGSEEIKVGDKQADALLKEFINKKDGKILGMQIPEPFASMATFFLPRIKGKISSIGEEPVRNAVTNLLTSAKVNPELAAKIGQFSGRGFAYGFPYITNIFDLYDTSSIHRENKHKLHQKLEPLLNANIAAKNEGILGSVKGIFSEAYAGNKMLEGAFGVISDNTYHNLKRDACSLGSTAVNNVATYLKPDDGQSASQAANDPEKKFLGIDRESAYKFLNDYGTEISGALEAGAKATMKRPDPMKIIQDRSLGSVFYIQEYMRTHEIGSVGNNPSKQEISQINAKVIEAFQKFQGEEKHGAIPSHRMNEVANQITEQLVYGDMHPLSLINIIGNQSLLNESKNGLVNSEIVQEVIAKEIAIFSKGATVNVTEFMSELNYTIDDVKHDINSGDKDRAALVTILHPESVLLAAGMKKTEINELRGHISNRALADMLSVVIDDLAQQPNRDLQDKGYSKDAIGFIHQLAGQPDEVFNAIENNITRESLLMPLLQLSSELSRLRHHSL
ncbi:MAG: hypothetical protein WCL30_05120, partial [Pseudomonadota bacterium]